MLINPTVALGNFEKAIHFEMVGLRELLEEELAGTSAK